MLNGKFTIYLIGRLIKEDNIIWNKFFSKTIYSPWKQNKSWIRFV